MAGLAYCVVELKATISYLSFTSRENFKARGGQPACIYSSHLVDTLIIKYKGPLLDFGLKIYVKIHLSKNI